MKDYNLTLPWPTDNYIVRCLPDAKFGPSNAGKPMLTLNFEILTPETVNIAGEDFNVAGTKTQPVFRVTKSIDSDGNVDAEKTTTVQTYLKDMYKKFGLAEPTDFDNIDVTPLKGIIVWAVVANKAVPKRKAPTAEQLAKGEKEGDVLVNPVTGEPNIMNFPEIKEFYGLPKPDVIASLNQKFPF